MPQLPTTQRAYTLRLRGAKNTDTTWREALWATHEAVNKGAKFFGDWLLTLRGGLSPSLADGLSERRVLLALSWLSVETRESAVPETLVIARGTDEPEDRSRRVLQRFRCILDRFKVPDLEDWISSCTPALTARIRRDAAWVDRYAAFETTARQVGMTREDATSVLLELLDGADKYFAMPTDDSSVTTEEKPLVIKAGNWLSANWGSGPKSDPARIADRLIALAAVPSDTMIGVSGNVALQRLCAVLDMQLGDEADAARHFKRIKQAVGWKGNTSKGALALESLVDLREVVSAELWSQIQTKLREEAVKQQQRAGVRGQKHTWMAATRDAIEKSIGMPFRTNRDHTFEYAVMLDHALRRVSAGHTWIKRAEAARRDFEKDAQKIADVPEVACCWLDRYCEERSEESGAGEGYLIRRRAIDAWDEIVRRWSRNDCRNKDGRIAAARELQSSPDLDKFGDIQLFEAIGDEDALAVWQRDGRADAGILKSYVAARTAEHDRRRFKVPAYRHPDPLRHPVFVDFGNSRWGVTYSALKAVQDREKLKTKLAAAKSDRTREKLQEQLGAAVDLRGVELGLWNGSAIEEIDLSWRGKRVQKDLDFHNLFDGGPDVSRADRLGRTVAGESVGAVSIAEVFEQKEWNGRLQAPRGKLDELADYLEKHGFHVDQPENWDDRARAMWRHLRWFLTFSAKLRPAGPWLGYVGATLPQGWEYRKSRSGSYYLNCAANRDRKGRARFKLARLPGLRALSVDLGHRYAAACAVWETLSRKQMEDACREANAKLPTPDALFLLVKRRTQKKQKSGRRKGQPVEETTVYRRIGADTLPDGSPHPAPWARLERQFLIKLQGEERSRRKPSEDELSKVNAFREWLGVEPLRKDRDADRRLRVPSEVDELMADVVRLARQGLRRHGDYARVAYALTATQKPISGGRTVEMNRQQRIEYLQDALVQWQTLANSTDYREDWARQMWDRWIVAAFEGPEPVAVDSEASRLERKKQLEQSRKLLRGVAERLVDCDNRDLHRVWAEHWLERNELWKRHLRWLRKWILPRGKGKSDKTIRRVGGVGYTRQASIRGLYQTLKAFRMRPEPDDLRKNVPEPGDESLSKFGKRILDALERLRENRIKQLASRIVEAALGVGTENRKHWEQGRKRPLARMAGPRHASCHSVVIENLEYYRPEQTRTRRENRRLMEWSARNVRKYLLEGCQLYGVHVEEVSAAFTSRQDSRTGVPGLRCEDLPVTEFLRRDGNGKPSRVVRRAVKNLLEDKAKRLEQEPFETQFEHARQQALAGRGEAYDRYVAQLYEFLSNTRDQARKLPQTVRLPRDGGEIFVAADRRSPVAGGLQADLNAAANIGLRALLDPDWPGAWWYVLVSGDTYVPLKDKIAGSAAVAQDEPLAQPPAPGDPAVGVQKARSRKDDKEPINLWCDLEGRSLQSREWSNYTKYWNSVKYRVIQLLREQAGLARE